MVGRVRAAARQPFRARAGASALAALVLAALVAGCGASTAPGTDPGNGSAPAPSPREEGEDPEAATLSAPSSSGAASPAESDATEARSADADADAPKVGSLVDDFPVDLLPVPRDAVLLVTSAVPVGESPVREVSLNLRTSMSVEEVMTLYRDVLTDAGFSEITPPTDDTAPTADATFTRSGGDELVTIGVIDVDGARTLTLGGRVRTGDDA